MADPVIAVAARRLQRAHPARRLATFRPSRLTPPPREETIMEIGQYVIVRSSESGCHAGVLAATAPGSPLPSVTLTQARRLWYWDGAATLSELAVQGTAKPDRCKFPCSVPEIVVHGVCEVLACTAEARASVEGVPEWSGR